MIRLCNTKTFISAPIAWNAYGVTTINHDLGFLPTAAHIVGPATTGSSAYTQQSSHYQGAAEYGCNISAMTATTISVWFGVDRDSVGSVRIMAFVL